MQASVTMMTPSIHPSSSPSVHSYGKSLIKTQHIAPESGIPGGKAMKKKMLVEGIATPFVAPPPPTTTEASTMTTPPCFLSQCDIPGSDDGLKNVTMELSLPSPLKKKKLGVTRDQAEWPLFLSCPYPTPIVPEDGDVVTSASSTNDDKVLSLDWRLGGEMPIVASAEDITPVIADATKEEAKDSNVTLNGSGAAFLDNTSPAMPLVRRAGSLPLLESRDDKDGTKQITISNAHRYPSSPVMSNNNGSTLEIHSSPSSFQASPDISVTKLGPEAVSSSTIDDVKCFPHRSCSEDAFKYESKSLEAISVASISSSLPSKDALWGEDDDDTHTSIIAVEIEWELDDDKDRIGHSVDKNDDEEWSFSTASDATFKAFDELSDLTSRTESDIDDDEDSDEGDDDTDVDNEESILQIAYDSSGHCDDDDDIHGSETAAATAETTGLGALHDRSLLDFLSNLCEVNPP